MKILYIVPFVPWEVKVRSFNLIPRLARRHEIYLVCVSNVEPNKDQKAWINRYCKKSAYVRHTRLKGMIHSIAALPTTIPMRIAYCRSNPAQDVVQKMAGEVQPDVVYVERWRALQFVPENLSAPLACDPTDSMTLYNRRLVEGGVWWEKLLGWEEHRKFLQYEGKLAQSADVTVFCSGLDMECVKQQAPGVRCELVPNGVDCEKYFFKRQGEEEPRTLVFAGSFKYRPNCLAARFFLEKVFPLVQRKAPGVKFVAVGNGAQEALAGYRGRVGFEAIDFVPELRPYLAKATVAVAPLTVGAGVSNKLAEGFAVGTPVVATPLACGDLPVKSGEHLLIGRTVVEFADHVLTLLKDPQLRSQMAVRARRFVEERYDWEIVSKKIEDILQEIATRTEASASFKQELATA